jgi:pimeloyl-ACP methyl ester carboxylesterase
MLARGFAVAGSSYSSNGWAVEDAIGDTATLTEQFSDITGERSPQNTILWGTSMGSVVTFALAEQRADLYDGFLAMCAVGAGSSRAWDGGLVLATAYEVAFGWPPRWGSFDDVKNTIDFETEVLYPTVGSLIDPANFGLWEFVRRVSNLPAEEFYGGPANWALTDMYFATEARAELERRAGGPVGRTDIYEDFTLSDEDKVALTNLGVDWETLLKEVNNLKGNPSNGASRAYIRDFADYTGDISDPMLTLHTTVDGLVPVEHESAYRDTIRAAHNQRLLVQLYVDDVGHCTFTGEELLAAADAIADWAIRRDKPAPEDFANIGRFDPDYEPGPWPFVRETDG